MVQVMHTRLQIVTHGYRGIMEGYTRLHMVTLGNRWLQMVTDGYRGLHYITGGYTQGYRELNLVTGALHKVTCRLQKLQVVTDS